MQDFQNFTSFDNLNIGLLRNLTNLTFSGHIRRIFNDNDPIFFCEFLEFNVPTRKTEERAAVDHYH